MPNPETRYGRRLEEQQALADVIRRMAGGDVSVQRCTVIETPWADPEAGEGE